MVSFLFGTDGIRGKANTHPIDPLTMTKLGMIIGSPGRTAVLGNDTRISGKMLESAITSGLISTGTNVILVGQISTPAMIFITKSLKADIGIIISASHNPYHDNGIKIVNRDGSKPSRTEERSIELKITQDLNHKLIQTQHLLGSVKQSNNDKNDYIKFAKNSFPKNHNLQNKKIVIDCSNGGSYQIAPQILTELGAEVIALNTNPNGININHQCGTLYPDVISKEVLKQNADFGISLDGDGDRLIICDEKGYIIDGEQILATILKLKLENKTLRRNSLVSNTMASLSFENYLKAHNINLFRSNVGDQHIVNCMKKNNCDIGGEPSGHIILAEYNSTSDGIIAALQILGAMCIKNISASKICSNFKAQPAILKNIPNDKGINLQSAQIKKFLMSEGHKLGNSGRLLIRESGTEKKIRILAEGNSLEKVQNTINNVIAFLSQY